MAQLSVMGEETDRSPPFGTALQRETVLAGRAKRAMYGRNQYR
jgi:hypothetical protein